MTELKPEKPLVTARRIATAVVRLYGEGGHDEQSMIDNGGIWNDHPAVQAALEALKLAAPETAAERGPYVEARIMKEIE